GIGQNPVKFRPQLLCEQIALPPAGRATIPVVVGRLHSVIGFRDRLGEEDLLLDRVPDEVVDELQIVGTVRIDAGFAVTAGVAGIGPGSRVPGIDGGAEFRFCGASAAADPLRPAVPGPLYAASASVNRIERQPYANVGVLVRIGAVQNIHLTVCDIRAARRDDVTLYRLDARTTQQPVVGISGKLDTTHRRWR